jgi:hypothetical protein
MQLCSYAVMQSCSLSVMQWNHSTFPPFHHSTIPPFHLSTIPHFHLSTFPLNLPPKKSYKDYHCFMLGYYKTLVMKIRKCAWFGLIFILFFAFTFACSSQKDVTERRNFMMPKKSEMSRNSHYKEPAKRKTNKVYANKSNRKSLF